MEDIWYFKLSMEVDDLLALVQLIDEFFLYAQSTIMKICNEFSLQNELRIFLRNYTIGYQIIFERNVRYFTIETSTIKKIDTVIISMNKLEKYAIVLKNPLNGQYPEQM